MHSYLRKSLRAFGITGAWRIVLPHNPDPAERIVAKELKGLLAKGSVAMKVVPERKASRRKCNRAAATYLRNVQLRASVGDTGVDVDCAHPGEVNHNGRTRQLPLRRFGKTTSAP